MNPKPLYFLLSFFCCSSGWKVPSFSSGSKIKIWKMLFFYGLVKKCPLTLRVTTTMAKLVQTIMAKYTYNNQIKVRKIRLEKSIL